jgi:hypothetical protein
LTGILEHYCNDVELINEEMKSSIDFYRADLDKKIFLIKIKLDIIKAKSKENLKLKENLKFLELLSSDKFHLAEKESLEKYFNNTEFSDLLKK